MALKRALITGVTGQDGSYLAELLLQKGYEVHGIRRRSSSFNTGRIDHLIQDPHAEGCRFFLHYGDMTDYSSLKHTIQLVEPDEIYNLAAQSHVAVSFEQPEYTVESDALGPLRMLEGIRSLGLQGKTRFYQASTSEMFGKAQEVPQSETTPFYPRSPYGVPSSMLTGSPRPIAEPMVSMLAAGSFSIMSRPSEAKHLLRAKLFALLPVFSWGIKIAFIWETLTLGGIGDMRAITWKQCGSCCNRTALMTT